MTRHAIWAARVQPPDYTMFRLARWEHLARMRASPAHLKPNLGRLVGMPKRVMGVVDRTIDDEAARFRGFWAFRRRCRGSCYKEPAGGEVVVVGEPVGYAS